MKDRSTTVVITETYYDFNDGNIGPDCQRGHTIAINGEIVYIRKGKMNLHDNLNEPLDIFINWLSGKEQPERRCDIRCNGCKRLDLIRYRRFKGLNFKYQLLKIRLKQFFLGQKSAV